MSDEQDTEKRIQEAGLTAPRLTPELIDGVIAGVTYTRLPSGRSIICEMTLKNGFTIRGESSVVSIENFREDIGKDLAYKDAKRQVWQLEAYLLKNRLFYGY